MNSRGKAVADFDKLVEALIYAASDEGQAASLCVEPMKPYYDRTHAARDALMDAIDKATRGVGGTDGR